MSQQPEADGSPQEDLHDRHVKVHIARGWYISSCPWCCLERIPARCQPGCYHFTRGGHCETPCWELDDEPAARA